MSTPRARVALYSPGMVGLGHVRRNLLIAQALVASGLQPAVLLIAEEAIAAFTESGAHRLVLIHRPDELPVADGVERASDGDVFEL